MGGIFKNIGSVLVTVNMNRELRDLVTNTIMKEGPNCDLNFIDTSKITDMSWMFDHSSFNNNISGWDVSKVKNMDGMFSNSKLEELGKLPIWYKQSAR